MSLTAQLAGAALVSQGQDYKHQVLLLSFTFLVIKSRFRLKILYVPL